MRLLSLVLFDAVLAAGVCTLTPDGRDASAPNVVAQDPKGPAIRLPSGPLLPPPSGQPVRLQRGVSYVIDSDVECAVRPHPRGLVTVQAKTGPRDITARLVDGTGEEEDRTYKGPYIYVVKAVPDGPGGRCEIDVVPLGLKAEADIKAVAVDVESGQAPRPPPTPVDPKVDPAPGPKPTDPPAPIPGDGLRVLIVYESTDLARYPNAQRDVLFAGKVRDYLNSHCATGPDGRTREWRQYDKDAGLGTESQVWKDAFARPRKSLPWIVVSNGRAGYEGPLPGTVDETLTLLKKYGGE